MVNIPKVFAAANTTPQDNPATNDVTLTVPTDDSYILDSSGTFTCNATNVPDWNISRIELWANRNSSDTWSRAFIYDVSTPTNNTAVGFSVTFTNLGDDSLKKNDTSWNCLANYTNATGNINTLADATIIWGADNYSVKAEYPPTVTLNEPDNNAWSNGTTEEFNFTVSTIHSTAASFDCLLYTNETNNFTALKSMTATNNTPYYFDFEVDTDILWGVKCFESTDGNIYNFSLNRTLRVDKTDPSVSITHVDSTAISNNSYESTTSNLLFNYSLTEINPKECQMYINGTANVSDTVKSDSDNNFSITFPDGLFTFYVECADDAGNGANSTTYWINLDSDTPPIDRIKNGSVGNYSDRWAINFTSDEEVNYTIFYGTTATGVNQTSYSSSFSNVTNVNLTSMLENTNYFFNITVCDRAGNCNTSGTNNTYGQHKFTFPFKIFAGWSYFAIYDSKINMSTIAAQTMTDYVYYWNSTDQSWIYHTAGASSEAGFNVGVVEGRTVVALYEGTNSTWVDRNVSVNVSMTHHYNFTSGHNFVKLWRSMDMSDLGESMLNSSNALGAGELVQTAVTPSLEYNMSQFSFSVYNNTGNIWGIDYLYNWSWNNDTSVGNLTATEVAWIHSPKNLSSDGYRIFANWTI